MRIESHKAGFSLVEILLAVSIFGLTVTALVGGLIFGEQSTALSGARVRAVMLADEGLEAVRNIRDENFSNLTSGTHGLTISGNQWTLSGTSDTTDIFTRQVTIFSVDTKRKNVTTNVTWQQNQQRMGQVEVVTYLTNWKTNAGPTPTPTATLTPTPGGPTATPTPTPVTCASYCLSLGGYTTGTCRQNTAQCAANGETYESGGDIYCTGGPSADTCCCAP